MAFTLKFETDNAAFEGDDGWAEVARILRGVAELVDSAGAEGGRVLDVNGNRVGTWTLDLPEAEEEDEEDDTDED